MKVSGKIAVITGGARGLGKGFAQALLGAGASVVIADVNPENGMKTVRDFQEDFGYGRATFMKCNVTKLEDLTRLFEKTKQMYGYIDIVVNNAGVSDESDIPLHIDINLRGVIYGCNLALEYMNKDNGGRGGLIVNIASTAGLTGVPFEPVYTATKHGVVGLTRALGLRRDDVIDQGIRVSSLCPSFAKTEMVVKAMEGGSDASRNSLVAGVGIMEISDVVNGFMKIVENDHLQGGVVAVTPNGVDVKFPRKFKAKL